MRKIGFGNPEVVKPIGELGTEEAKTGGGLFDFCNQRGAVSCSRGFEGDGKAKRTGCVMNPRFQLGEVASALLVPEFPSLVFKDAG
jgi:hypothetical protein